MIWHIPFYQNKQKAISVPKCFFVKKTLPQGNAKWIYRKSYLYCLTPQGEAKAFLQAIQKEQPEQAKRYLSRTMSQVDMQEIKKDLVYDKTYRFFTEQKSEKMCLVTLASAKRKEMLFFCMVAEPDDLGTWKILGIGRE